MLDPTGCRDSRLLRRDGEALAAPLATGRDHLPATLGLHARAEAVDLLAMAVAGTIRALHASKGLGGARGAPRRSRCATWERNLEVGGERRRRLREPRGPRQSERPLARREAP